MNEDKNILNKINRKSGMTVPNNYFTDFAEKMMQNLPKKEESIIATPPTAWQRYRPYIYLAAMFAGIWCMIKMVNLMGSSTPGSSTSFDQSEQIFAQAIEDETLFNDYYYDEIDEYSILESIYEDGIDTESLLAESTTY